MKYFAIVIENPNKTWEYMVFDSDSLESLKEEIQEMQNAGDLKPNARIVYYEGNRVDE